ncbi:hypothetical protein NAP1_11828 [Erythrobacter sp. NAP1]|uniref:hypothetical protein n=1 Tax=Erythrobacter sp. NAP1 TaxID=237727 RepID=UPI00006879D5|nr:hypothetical protein [Erythrobacter sp. NAP1]EAQ28283.1 hypothetical protein NAP1_11828 [Erythrobacter sp. NAP1]
MEGRKIYKLALLAGAATMLQGCVAAVVPLAASGLMGASAIDGDDEPAAAVAGPVTDPSVIIETSPSQSAFVESSPAPAPQTSSVTRMAVEAQVAAVEEPAQLAVELPDSASAATAEEAMTATEMAATASVESTPSASDEFTSAFAETENSVETMDGRGPAMSASEDPELVATIEQPEAAPVSGRRSDLDDTSVRRITVDSQVALADTTANEPTVSAAEAAAALATGSTTVAAATTTAAPSATVRNPAVPPEPSADQSPVIPISASASSASDPTAITALISYANQSKFEFTPGQSRTSAMLIDRVNLEADRANCVGIQPTVLIDLDPKEGTFSPVDAQNPPAGLAAGLDRLRAAGVAIAWISSGSSSFSEIYRDALARTGLDESGADQLLLMRGPDDRKQIRREQLAQQTCLIAIAGDDRSDFDELYDYLLNPGDAAVLEPLIGEGWFLIPTPLLSERPN